MLRVGPNCMIKVLFMRGYKPLAAVDGLDMRWAGS